jgi:hypothetical protein
MNIKQVAFVIFLTLCTTSVSGKEVSDIMYTSGRDMWGMTDFYGAFQPGHAMLFIGADEDGHDWAIEA